MIIVSSGFETSKQDLVEYPEIVRNLRDIVAGGK